MLAVGDTVTFSEPRFPLTGAQGLVINERPFSLTVQFEEGKVPAIFSISTWPRAFFAKGRLTPFACRKDSSPPFCGAV